MKSSMKKILLITGAAFCAMAVSACAKSSSAGSGNAFNTALQGAGAALTGGNQNNGAAGPQYSVTPEQAKEIAAAHAGVNLADAEFSKEKLDKGVYELKFRDARGKYEYGISAVDGQILNYEWDVEVENGVPDAPADSSYITAAVTAQQAKEIAAAHAGVNLADAEFIKEKLDDGVYELKFRDANGKYEYEISAVDGQILDYERDVDVESGVPDAPDDSSYMEGAVSEKQAREIALASAGLNAEQLKFITSYLQWRQHAPYAYEVKFSESTAPYRTYRYLIDLYTGDILGGGMVKSH